MCAEGTPRLKGMGHPTTLPLVVLEQGVGSVSRRHHIEYLLGWSAGMEKRGWGGGTHRGAQGLYSKLFICGQEPGTC